MNHTSEIYLNKKFIPKDEWSELIQTISNFNGALKKWQIIIENHNNELRYFINTECSLPSTINNLNSFLLKPIDEIKNAPKADYSSLFFPDLNSNIIDLINISEIKNKGVLECLEINITKLYEEKLKVKTKIYLRKDNALTEYRLHLAKPVDILSVDFEGNKRYFYKTVPKYLDISKILYLLSTDANNSLLKIDTFPYLQGNFYLNQSSFNFDKHSIILGSSGSGKSKFISLLISNINSNYNLKQKYKVVMIDPHAAMEKDIGGIAKVIDFKTALDSIDLFINNNDDVTSGTELLIELLKSLIADQYNSKLERVLRHTIHLLLTDESFNFVSLRKVLLDLEYRNDLITKLKSKLPTSVVDFFLSDFNELKTKSYSEAISPIIGFIDEMEMIPVFNTTEKHETLKNTIHDNFLTIFSLDRTKLGDKVTKAISGLVMQQLLTIIQRGEINEHIIFVVDEVATIENPILSRFLSEARKYNLSLILAGQYFSQISEELKNSIFANVINYFIFRVSKLDANVLVDNFNMKIPLDDTKERKTKILTELNNRECIARIDVNGALLPAFKGRSVDFESIPRVIEDYQNYENIEHLDVQINQKPASKFSTMTNTSLKDILLSNSSSRKVVNKNE